MTLENAQMHVTSQDSTWDFSPVLNLISSLSHVDVATHNRSGSSAPGVVKHVLKKEMDETAQGLGDFGQLWDFLGVQREVPVPSVPTFEAATAAQKQDRDAYASDGALYYPASSKEVRWRDEAAGLDLAATQPDSPPSPPQHGLTRTQRKKKNRQARLLTQSANTGNREQRRQHLQPVGLPKEVAVESAPKKEERWPASIEACTNSNTSHSGQTRYFLRSSKGAQAGQKDAENTSADILDPGAAASTQASLPQAPQLQLEGSTLRPSQIAPKLRNKMSTSAISTFDGLISTVRTSSNLTPTKLAVQAVQESLKKRWSTSSNGVAPQSCNGMPAVLPSTPSYSQTMRHIPPTPPVLRPATNPRKRHDIQPLHLHTSDDRNWSLLLKLLHNFPSDRSHLLSPLQLSINRPQPNGIHVFIDASNIIIGFQEHFKRVRGISHYARVPRVDLSFHALALLLERRRPVAKRVLSGSTPVIPAFEEAREVGYETCILDKVWKAKELTEKQRRFAAKDAMGSGYIAGVSGNESAGAPPLVSMGGLGGGTNNLLGSFPPQQPKWVEQAVDEILHLKILESVIDTPIPARASSPAPTSVVAAKTSSPTAPTMVLATGDAAEAEYSQGFMKMVERALVKGWNVEVAAWSATVSMGYRRMEKQAGWGERFRIIELDDYSEELFGKMVD